MDRDEQIVSDLTVRRPERIVAYACLTLSGAAATIWPSALVEEQVGSLVGLAWSVGMLIGAGSSLFGSVTDRWIGEFAGLRLLVSVLVLYGLSALLEARNSDSFFIIAYGLLVIALSTMLYARWKDVKQIKRASEQKDDTRNKGE